LHSMRCCTLWWRCWQVHVRDGCFSGRSSYVTVQLV
jgi:hypothetical protein